MNVAGELAIRKIRIGRHRADLKDLLSYIDELHLKLFRISSKDMPATLSRDIKRVFEHRAEEFDRIVDELSLTTSALQDDVMRMRMLPLEVIFQTFPRFVRDLSRKEKKLIDFHITGENTELDKAMIEKMQDPLMHMLRNAVIHGIEWPDDRAKAGKSPSGKISLRAYCKGSQVIIEVEDDGRGIDPDKIIK